MQVKHLRNDYKFMPQITSSAVWNNPPPAKLITLLHATNRAGKVCHGTREKMVRAFQVLPAGTTRMQEPKLHDCWLLRDCPPSNQVDGRIGLLSRALANAHKDGVC